MTPARVVEGRESAQLAMLALAQGVVVHIIPTDGHGLDKSTTQRAKPIADLLARQHVFLPVGETLLQVGNALQRQSAQTTEQVTPQVTGKVAGEVRRLLAVMAGEMKRAEIQQALGLRHEAHFRDAYLGPALEASVIEMKVPDKPRNSKHRYRLTERGCSVLQHSDA